MSNWTKKEYEICDKPEEGELVQFGVLSYLQLAKWGIDFDEVRFFMREINNSNLQ